jgi:hypothetical protein
VSETDPPPPDKPRISPWPDRIALILIWLAGIAITLLWQRPKGAGLYADFWFGAMITLALILGYAMLKRALGLPPVTLKLRRPKTRR